MTLVNLERATSVLSATGLDALVATLPENVRYCTDLDTQLLETAGLRAAALLTRASSPG